MYIFWCFFFNGDSAMYNSCLLQVDIFHCRKVSVSFQYAFPFVGPLSREAVGRIGDRVSSPVSNQGFAVDANLKGDGATRWIVRRRLFSECLFTRAHRRSTSFTLVWRPPLSCCVPPGGVCSYEWAFYFFLTVLKASRTVTYVAVYTVELGFG